MTGAAEHIIKIKQRKDLDPVRILSLDNHLIVAVKPAGVLSQADRTGDPDMLTLLKGYLKELFHKPGAVFLGLVHRLDRPVGGVMVFARTSKAASRLSEQIRRRTVKKTYLAVVQGRPLEEAGRLDDSLLRDWGGKGHRIVKETDKGARPSSLTYRLLAYSPKENLSLLAVNLLTGRTHQIRLQFAARQLPLWGDTRYGAKAGGTGGRGRPGHSTGEIGLWAYAYYFDHPTLKERRRAVAPPPRRYPWTCFPHSVYESFVDE